MTRGRQLHRKAFTLIEMLIAITIGSSIMVASVALLHRSFELHKLTQTRMQQEQTIDRLIEQFRSDVYAASSVEVLAPSKLSLEIEGRDRIVYSALDNQLSREFSQPTEQRQSIELGPSISASLDVIDDGQRVRLAFQHKPEPSSQSERRRIEVTVGRLATAIALTNGIAVEGSQ